MLLSTDAILALLGVVFLALAGEVSSFPSSPVYGRLQRNAVSYPEGRYPHSDPNYYALLRGDVPLGGPASSPDWGQFLPAPWTGADAYNGGAGPIVVPAVGPQYDDYADEYDASSSVGGVQFPPSSNVGYDWYEAQGQPQQPQQQQQLEQQELQEAAVFKDLLANYLSKKSNDAEKRSETAKKYTAAGVARGTSTTARPNVAVLTVPKGAAASAQVALSSSSAAPSTAPPKSAASSSSSSSSRAAPEAFPVPVSQEGGQKEYAMFRPVGTAESRRPTFWRGGAKQANTGAATAHGKVTRSRFGRFADDTLTEELDQLKAQ